MTFFELVLFPACLVISWALTLWYAAYAHKVEILAHPNERSSHYQSTPTSGGWTFVITPFLYLCYLLILRREFPPSFSLILLLGTTIAVIGYIDDRRHVPAGMRLLTHIICVLMLLLAMPSMSTIELFNGFSLAFHYQLLLFLLAGVWLINLFNFMDGIDGIAGVEAITALSGAALILWLNGGSSWLEPMMVVVFSVAGFLIVNWPPAKIFMGDVGSGFLGFTLVALALFTSAEGVISVWSWLILLSVFVVDASVTLVRRGLRKEKIHQAHRSHAYQILARRWGSHQKVTLMVLLINLMWLLPLAWYATFSPNMAWLVAMGAYLPLISLVYLLGAGTTND